MGSHHAASLQAAHLSSQADMGSHIRRRTYSATESRLGLWDKAQQLWFLCEPRCFALHCCVCGSHFQRSGMAVSIGRKVRALQLLFFDPGCRHHPFAEVTFLFWVIFFVINVKQGQQKGGEWPGNGHPKISKGHQGRQSCVVQVGALPRVAWEPENRESLLGDSIQHISKFSVLLVLIVSVIHIHKVWQDLVRRGLFNSFYLEDRPLYACAHQCHMIPLTIKTAWSFITFSPYSKDFKGSLSQREAWAFPAPGEAFSTSGRSEALCRSLWNDQRKGRNCERNDIHNISQSRESSHVRMSFPAR